MGSMRRSATVTSSVALCSIAAAIASSERKPPVPEEEPRAQLAAGDAQRVAPGFDQ
jgi:hypothetical protein